MAEERKGQQSETLNGVDLKNSDYVLEAQIVEPIMRQKVEQKQEPKQKQEPENSTL